MDANDLLPEEQEAYRQCCDHFQAAGFGEASRTAASEVCLAMRTVRGNAIDYARAIAQTAWDWQAGVLRREREDSRG